MVCHMLSSKGVVKHHIPIPLGATALLGACSMLPHVPGAADSVTMGWSLSGASFQEL